MKKTLLFFLCILEARLFGQYNTKVAPDCVIQFSFTAAGSTDNNGCGTPNGPPNQPGIASWILVYSNTGFSGLSLTVQSAPDNAGVPGSWGTFAGTVLSSTQFPGSSGINPNTSITSAFTGFAGYYPWMRVNLSGLTGSGTVKGTLMGFLNSTLARSTAITGVYSLAVAGQSSGGTAFSMAQWSTNAPACTASTISGPNSVAYNVCYLPLTNTNDVVMVQVQPTATWTAGLRSIDVAAILWQNDGVPAAGTWQIQFIVGCANTSSSSGGTFSYVVGAVDSSTPPAQFGYETFLANNLTPTGCAAGSFLQIWMQRQADSGGSTGVTPRVVSMQVTLRGS